MSDELRVPGVPFPLTPSAGAPWRVDEAAGVVTVAAAPHSDIFVDPGGDGTLNAESMLNAATLLGVPPEGDFQLSARVVVDFGATYDAGVLLLWVDERHWGKLCFEYSPAGEPMIVSVVCRGVADDANAFTVSGRSVWLRVARIDRAYAYHASLDGETWRMIRFFALGDGSTTEPPGDAATAEPRGGAAATELIGFEAQSPTGDGCRVMFDEIRFVRARLGDLRDGS